MKQEIKERWLDRLENGNLPQAIGYLRVRDTKGNINGYCCLGVLCEIAVEDGIIEHNPDDYIYAGYLSKPDDSYVYPYDENSTLPKEVMVWAGLDSANPLVEMPEPQDEGDEDFDPEADPVITAYNLSSLNDEMGMTFPEIAKLIREQL